MDKSYRLRTKVKKEVTDCKQKIMEGRNKSKRKKRLGEPERIKE